MQYASLAILSACASVNPDQEFAQARELTLRSTGASDVFDPDAPLLNEQQISAQLADGLGVDEAVRLALIHNRRLHAEFMSIGVAKADWVQSGLLRNPTLSLAVLLPEGGGRTFIEASIAQNLVELWQIPTRRRIARHNLDATILRIAVLAGELASDTRRGYYEAVAGDELLRVAQENADLLHKSHEAIRRKLDAGAASRIDQSLALNTSLGGELAMRSARLEAANARRNLARLLSLDRNFNDVLLTDPLPILQPKDLDPERLVVLARSRRLDLQAYEAVMHAAGIEVALERRKAFGTVEAGARVEYEDKYKVGPTLSLDIPIFDQNQAQVARRKYLHQQAVKTYEAAYLQAAQDIRTTIDIAQTATLNLSLYRQTLVPQAQSNLDLATQAYNAGQFTILGLIESQQRLLDARRGMIQSQRDAAAAMADLLRVTGGPVETDPQTENIPQ